MNYHTTTHVHRTLHMYEHIHICLHILQCTHKHTTHSIAHIYTLVHHPYAHNTNTLHTYIAHHGYTHITYNIYLHPHIQQITHMYTQHQYITYTYIPHICTCVPSHSCTNTTNNTLSEPCRYTQYSDTTNKMNILQNTHALNTAHLQIHNTLHMPQLYRHIPHICSYTNTKHTHAHSLTPTYHR